MRRIATLLLVLSVVTCLAGTALAEEKAATETCNLFNGESLAGWDYFLVDKDVKMADVWSVKDGLLVCKGEPLGYLYTKEKYDNFKLIVEWRWAPGGEPGNSGVLLRIDGDAVSFLPKCIEAQLKSGSAGDLYGFHGCKISGPADRFKERENPKLGKIRALPKIKAAEKEPGQWNKYEIAADGSTVSVIINGEKVNEATDCDVLAGPIGLQSEGGEIHFRTVKLIPLEK